MPPLTRATSARQTPPPATSAHGSPLPVFQAAYKELCTRIWIELELLAQANTPMPQDLTMSTAVLRLELVVLVDSCRSPRWRHLLTTEQRDSLCSMLTDVLAALYVDPDHLHTAITAAQDRVLDELIPEPGPIACPAKASRTDRKPKPMGHGPRLYSMYTARQTSG